MTPSPHPTPVTPTEYPRARNEDLQRVPLDTPVGLMELVAAPAGLRAVLWPGEDGRRVQRALTGLAAVPGLVDPSSDEGSARAHLDAAAEQITEYFTGTRTKFELVLDPRGTPFQLRVWEALRAIPFGQTRTYAQQARVLGEPGAARAVGAADGRNPLSIVVPCHRVLGASGGLTGFAGGVATKAWLLEHERAICAVAG